MKNQSENTPPEKSEGQIAFENDLPPHLKAHFEKYPLLPSEPVDKVARDAAIKEIIRLIDNRDDPDFSEKYVRACRVITSGLPPEP